MAVRLLVVAHGRAGSAVDPVFGDPGALPPDATVVPVEGRVQGWVTGPEQACRDTTERLATRSRIEPALAGPDLGRWAGRTLSEVAAADPAGLRTWLSDPASSPHGGESLAAACARIGRVCDKTGWPDGRTVLVVAPSAARLLAVHGIGGSAELSFALDVRPGGRFELSRHGGRWRLILG
jgi:broad specificity phosphatase PhoE